MIKLASFLLGAFLLFDTMAVQADVETQKTQTESAKTVIIDIPSDLPPSPSDEAIVPQHLFSDETTGYDVFEKVEELEARIKKLEDKVTTLEQKGL